MEWVNWIIQVPEFEKYLILNFDHVTGKSYPGMMWHLGEEECAGNYVLVFYFKHGSMKCFDNP